VNEAEINALAARTCRLRTLTADLEAARAVGDEDRVEGLTAEAQTLLSERPDLPDVPPARATRGEWAFADGVAESLIVGLTSVAEV
jgi:hypothetical protein